MTAIYSSLKSALELQASGSQSAVSDIRNIIGLVCSAHRYRDDDLSAAQVTAIELLLREWKEMFSFEPGRLDALPLLIAALKAVRYSPEDADLKLPMSKSWAELKALRGPGNDVVVCTCETCTTQYIGLTFGSHTSGREGVFCCTDCGHIRIDPRAPTAIQPCRCGSTLHLGCPNCGGIAAKTHWHMRPWQYFMNHTFEIANAAG